jgi:hypothetical protein
LFTNRLTAFPRLHPQFDLPLAKRPKRPGTGHLDLARTLLFRFSFLDVEQRSFAATVGEGRKITATFLSFSLRCAAR